MLGTLIPIAALFLLYSRFIDRWAEQKYPRLVDDSNRRQFFSCGMTMLGIVVFTMLWGYTIEFFCRV